MVKGKSKKNLPATVNGTPPAVDVGRGVRHWWKTRDPGEAAAKTSLLGAVSDLGMMCLGHLARRMDAPEGDGKGKTPVHVKDAIALAFAPKVVAEFKGKLPSNPQAPEGGGVAGGLAEAYGITVRP